MKIEIELPDWCEDCSFFLQAGIENVAFKLKGDKEWKIKTSRCHMCGYCCGRGKPDVCEYLYERGPDDWQCKWGINRPFSCCATRNTNRPVGCTERFNDETQISTDVEK